MSHMPSLPADAVIADLNKFDQRSGTFAERLLFNNRLAITLICLLITLVLGYQALGAFAECRLRKDDPHRPSVHRQFPGKP
jgi:hypothetical protein